MGIVLCVCAQMHLLVHLPLILFILVSFSSLFSKDFLYNLQIAIALLLFHIDITALLSFCLFKITYFFSDQIVGFFIV